MKSFWKLVDFELSRFSRIYVVLIGMTVVLQLMATIIISKLYLDHFDYALHFEELTIGQFIEQYGKMSLEQVTSSMWFNIPIIFSIVALIFYCFFIWYRDWFGKNTFIYRLLMLPTPRINLYFSKAAAIFLMVLGLVAMQVILLIIQGNILKWLVPANLRIDYSVMELIGDSVGNYHLAVIIPYSFTQFLTHYGLGFMAVFILFTAILFERSYRLKGIFLGIGYAIVAIAIFLSPYFIAGDFLYPEELFIVGLVLWALVTGMSIWIGNYLLNKKITV